MHEIDKELIRRYSIPQVLKGDHRKKCKVDVKHLFNLFDF